MGTLKGFPNPPKKDSAGLSPAPSTRSMGTLKGFPNPPKKALRYGVALAFGAPARGRPSRSRSRLGVLPALRDAQTASTR